MSVEPGVGMVEAIIGGFLLFALGLGLTAVAQTMMHNALQDPGLIEQKSEIDDALRQASNLKQKVDKAQAAIADSVEEIERVRSMIKSNETRIARVTRHFRIVVEHGAQSPKSKRFDGSVFNRNANAAFGTVGGTTVPSFYAHEVQVVIWEESLNAARDLFEKTYAAKDGYSLTFHGEVFGAKG